MDTGAYPIAAKIVPPFPTANPSFRVIGALTGILLTAPLATFTLATDERPSMPTYKKVVEASYFIAPGGPERL
jgi:hypothetical protein